MFWKKHKWKIIVPVCLLALLAFAFWYGGDAPGLQGWKVEKRQTATEAPVASLLSACLAKASVKAKFIGIGGGTLAALLRRRGIPAVVWSTIASSCHEPNEHSSIQSTIDDTKVFALMAMRAKP